MKIGNYLDQLTLEYTQLCQRNDGSIYGIASGKQCLKGKPISYNPNLANLGGKKGLKQVKVSNKDKVANIVAKAKAIGLTNKEIRDIKEEVKVELNKKRVRGTEALKLFAKKANALAKTKDKGNQKPVPKSKPKPDIPKPKAPKSIQDNPDARYRNRKEALENSPKYSQVPGSTTPVEKKKLQEYVRIANDLLKNPYYQDDSYLKSFAKGGTENIPLAVLYVIQGFNNRPELVPSVKDLKERKDLLKKNNGENIIFYRGSNDAFTSQFLGVGRQGNIHGAGKGLYGNGTYAAATNKKWDKEEKQAKKSASGYAPGIEPEDIRRQVVTFGLRADANIVDIDGKASFWNWQNDIIKQARKATGLDIKNVGHAAAAMGIHAYKVPGGNTSSQEEDYWVILNRGAVVATIEEFE